MGLTVHILWTQGRGKGEGGGGKGKKKTGKERGGIEEGTGESWST